MTRTVNGARLFEAREKEVLRRMIWQVAEFSGVEVLTYCVLSNHFHVLVRVPVAEEVADGELLRRYGVLYPGSVGDRTAPVEVLRRLLSSGGAEAEAVRRGLLSRMGDVSEYMKALKQRFSVWYNRSHGRFGTLWAERFKSVLVEGQGNALQTMAAYIDLNAVRAGLVTDPKDYRYCGYAEAVAGRGGAQRGLRVIWAAYADGSEREPLSIADAMQMHRELIFGKCAARAGQPQRAKALQVLEKEHALLPKAVVLRCRVRYFTDGAILGSQEFVRGFAAPWQRERGRKHPPKVHPLPGADWGGLAAIRGLRSRVFG